MKKIIFYVLIAIAFTGNVAQAQTNYTLLEPLPCIPGTGNNCTQGNTISQISLDTYIEYVFKFSIALAVFLAIVMIIWGGFEYMTSESPFGKSDGKSRITNAIIGLLGALVSYLILLTIDPRLVQINSRIDPIKINTSEVTAFQNRFANELRGLGAVERQRVVELSDEIQTLTKKKEDLDSRYKYNQDPSDPDYIDDEDYNLESARLNSKIKELQSEQDLTTIRGLEKNTFGVVQSIIYDPNTFRVVVENRELRAVYETSYGNGTQVKTTLEQLDASYDKIAQEMGERDDIEGIKKIERIRSFYTEQIRDEEQLAKNIAIYQSPNYAGAKDLSKVQLEADYAEYSKPYVANPDPRYQEFEEMYKKIRTDRLERLKKVLKK
jgi:hypothetical protein